MIERGDITSPWRHDPLIAKAIAFVNENNGPIKQGLAMAKALSPLNCDLYTLAASILYPTLSSQPGLRKTLSEQFDKYLNKLIAGALRMDAIHNVSKKSTRSTAQQNQIDNLRKMLLAMVDDIRVVLIKLAERLVVLQNSKEESSKVQKRLSQEVMDYYVPLANRLGIGHLKWHLEDWAFRYLNTEAYQRISKALKQRRQDREKTIEDMIAELKTLLTPLHLKEIGLSGRAKHIYSIYKKIKNKDILFEELYDTSAVRILVPTIDDCYAALSVVHARWPHIQSEFDDYIAKPKPNGYQSIHTAIQKADGFPIEIQIRTFDMHEKAELGVAAHWKYKENHQTQSTYEEKIAWLREVLDWQQLFNEKDEQVNVYQTAFADRVYVFSPAGDVFDLPAGSTPLDFAYLIHTNVGHRCKGVKINQKLVPLTHPLKTGDQVDILTTKTEQPSRDWMRPENKFLVTQHALRKVRHWFRLQDYDKNLQAGHALWEKTVKQKGLVKGDLSSVVKHFNFKNEEGLLAALGCGELQVTNLLHQLYPEDKAEASESAPPFKKISETSSAKPSLDFTGTDISTLLTQLAKCCNPIPGDKILGFITKNKGISVHHHQCQNIQKALQDRPEKVIEIQWKEKGNTTYRLRLSMDTEDRPGLLHDISNLLKQMNLSILSLQSHVNEKTQTAHFKLTLALKTSDSVNTIMQRLRHIAGVIQVDRDRA